MARIKLKHPRRPRVEGWVPDYRGMTTLPEQREITVTNQETGNSETAKVTVQVPVNRAVKRAAGARGEALNGLATLMAGFPQKRAWKRVSGGRLR